MIGLSLLMWYFVFVIEYLLLVVKIYPISQCNNYNENRLSTCVQIPLQERVTSLNGKKQFVEQKCL